MQSLERCGSENCEIGKIVGEARISVAEDARVAYLFHEDRDYIFSDSQLVLRPMENLKKRQIEQRGYKVISLNLSHFRSLADPVHFISELRQPVVDA